jgi:hypothetical protein
MYTRQLENYTLAKKEATDGCITIYAIHKRSQQLFDNFLATPVTVFCRELSQKNISFIKLNLSNTDACLHSVHFLGG